MADHSHIQAQERERFDSISPTEAGGDASRRDSQFSTQLRDDDETIRHKYKDSLVVCQKCHKEFDHDEEAFIQGHDHTSQDENSKLVNWDGPNDPSNPKNLPKLRKWLIVVTTGLMTFCVSFASGIFSTAVFATAEEFNVSNEVMLLGVSLYVLGFAFGPLVWGPLSEIYGRTRPLWTGMVVFCIFQIPVAVAPNLETIFICRFFAGLFGSAPLAIIGGMYVDFMETVERGIASAVFAGATFAGPVAGPVIGSFITESYLGWRWTAWITLIMSVFFSLLALITTPETFEPTLLRWKAQRLRHETQDWSLHAKSEEQNIDMNSLLTKYLTKPMRMIAKEPILMILTFYMSICYGILYLTFEGYPISFQFNRGWSAGRLLATGKLNPEDRCIPMILGSIILPIGLFWFAWTSDPSIPWPAQVISGVFIGAGIILIFMSSIVYLIDVYLLNANSALAINTFIRSGIAASFPMFATYMYEGLGVAWATSVLGFVCVALIPFPFIFWFYGARIRTRSKFAFNLG
ncbi:hypothetical protein BP6252_06834 [Coleophoma cylindrospora]|uniref:Major facilitator superfamily (MFS) profile domain-containing protein n=1 Tax=Coleophoma cylindrospora TaxID=1849047 RepID=A0A3D8RFV9_9HELO|nr:hypothetical protein BP6252_06834 [Coleophoma cylindrospora]